MPLLSLYPGFGDKSARRKNHNEKSDEFFRKPDCYKRNFKKKKKKEN